MNKVVLFGAGKRTESIIKRLRNDIVPILIIDNDHKKCGNEICGIRVGTPKEIIGLNYDYVVIVPYDYYQIQKQLIELGISNKAIINCTHYEAVCEEEIINIYKCKAYKKGHNGKNILAFSHSLSSTGAQNVLITSLRQFLKLGYTVTLVSTEDGELRNELVDLGIDVYIVHDLYTHRGLIDELVRNSFLVLINTLWLYYIINDFELNHVKIVWWIHESVNIEYIDSNVFFVCVNKHIEVYAVSEVVKMAIEEVASDIAIQVDILRFGIPYYVINSNPHKKVNVVVLAAMAYIKGQDIFIEAVKKIRSDIREKADFYLIGGGKRSDEIVSAANANGIHIWNAVPHNNISDVYEMVDIIVCPSRKEAMSVTVVEAMMHEKMTIVSDATGISHYIEHEKNGMIFESENVNQLYNLLERAISDDEERKKIGKNGRDVYDAYFSLNVHEDNLKRICESKN